MDYTTELSAINSMLATIGEAPISTAEDLSVVDAVMAKATLDEVTRSVLVEGWAFNTDIDYPFSPEGFPPYEITLPPNAMSVIASPENEHVIARGRKLYDTKTRSFSFPNSGPILCDVVWSMPFDDLPEVTRQYVYIRAARLFQGRVPGIEPMNTLSEEMERQARWQHRKHNSRVRRRRYLYNSAAVSRIHLNR